MAAEKDILNTETKVLAQAQTPAIPAPALTKVLVPGITETIVSKSEARDTGTDVAKVLAKAHKPPTNFFFQLNFFIKTTSLSI